MQIYGHLIPFVKYPLFFLLSVLCCGCLFLADPADIGDAAYCNNEPWIPPYKIKREEHYCEEQLPEQTPVSVAELIDYGLRNNPQTRTTWNNARASAFTLYANYNTFYPHITATEELDFVQSHFGVGATGAGLGGVSNLINSSTAINNVNNAANPNNLNNVSVVGGGGGIIGGAGAATGATTGAVYNQILITELSVSYIMLDFGGRQASVEAARQALFSANWTHNRALQTVILTILQSYYNYIAAQATVKADMDNLKNAKQNMDSAKAMYDAGVARLVDYLLARSSYVNAQLLLEQAYNNQFTTMGQLATAIGLPADKQLNVAPMPEKLPEVKIEQDMHSLLDKAKEYRPDLAAAYSNYLNAAEQITIQFSAGMPIVGAFADYERINFIHSPANNGYISSAGVTATGPLFDGFLARNLTRSAQASAAASYATYKSVEEQAFLDVVTSYYSFKTAIETVKYSKEYLQYAQEAYNVAYFGYREGVNTLLDLLTATVALANARTAYIQARTQYVTSIAALAYATGTLD
jgi:outer membrane protein